MTDIPTTLPTGVRRTFPWKDSSRRSMVPLYSHEQGEEHQGKLTVPVRLSGTKPHTNERLEFERFIGEKLQAWIVWKAKNGYAIEGVPKVYGPYEPMTANAQAEPDEEGTWYWVSATFRRTSPLYVGLDDFLAIKDKADMYGVDINAPLPAALPIQKPVDAIVAKEPAHDPMQYAEERRRRLGLQRKDLIIEEMWQE